MTDAAMKREGAVSRLRALYGRYGYSQYRMRKFEEYDLYVRNKSFLISDHIITFNQPGGKLMALKPDVTLSIVKNSKETHHQAMSISLLARRRSRNAGARNSARIGALDLRSSWDNKNACLVLLPQNEALACPKVKEKTRTRKTV